MRGAGEAVFPVAGLGEDSVHQRKHALGNGEGAGVEYAEDGVTVGHRRRACPPDAQLPRFSIRRFPLSAPCVRV